MSGKAIKKSAKIKTSKTAHKVGRKNLGGRPPLFETPEQMQAKIEEYFATRVPTFKKINGKTIKDKLGNPIINLNPPTVSGLARYLGFSSRTNFYEYGKKEGFSDTVKKAVLCIEEYAERQLFENPKPTGAIFWMKNHGWNAEENKKVSLVSPVIVDDIPEDNQDEGE